MGIRFGTLRHAPLALVTTLLLITATIPSRAQVSGGERIFENLRMGLFSPPTVTLRGVSGGAIPLRGFVERDSTDTGLCAGFIDTQPDHLLTLDQFFDFLSLEILSPEDTTLLVQGPGGSWCNDDYAGHDPAILGAWLPGTYQIWVGSYRQDRYHPYLLRISRDPDAPDLRERETDQLPNN